MPSPFIIKVMIGTRFDLLRQSGNKIDFISVRVHIMHIFFLKIIITYPLPY